MEDFNIFDQSIIYEILFLFNSNNCQVDYWTAPELVDMNKKTLV